MMVSGYLTTIMIAMVPPLRHKLMTPKVLAWDRDYATAEELELAARENQKERHPRLRGRRAPAFRGSDMKLRGSNAPRS